LSLEQRYGIFRIDDAFLRNEPEVALDVMKLFLVTRAHYDMCSRAVEYTAMSTLFPKMPAGTTPFEYEIIITRHDDHIVDVKAERLYT